MGSGAGLPRVRLTAEEEKLCHAVGSSFRWWLDEDERDAKSRAVRRMGAAKGVREASVKATARSLMVLECEGMIWKAVEKRKGGYGIADDLAAECRLAVLGAVDGWQQEARFLTYVRPFITGAIIDAEASLRYGVALPRAVAIAGNKVLYDGVEGLTELEANAGTAALNTMYAVEGLESVTDATVDEDGYEVEWSGDPADPEAEFEEAAVEALYAGAAVQEALEGLSESHSLILQLKYLGAREATDAEVGLILGVSRQAASQMLARAQVALSVIILPIHSRGVVNEITPPTGS